MQLGKCALNSRWSKGSDREIAGRRPMAGGCDREIAGQIRNDARAKMGRWTGNEQKKGYRKALSKQNWKQFSAEQTE